MHELITNLPTIINLIILEGLLSVDNALVLAAMVSHLPTSGVNGDQQRNALRYGMLGAYVMRGASLFAVEWIIAYPIVKWLGALYLIYLMCENLGTDGDPDGDGNPHLKRSGFWGTIIAVELADMAFSIDNIIAAVALSSKMWVVIAGVFIGIAAMRFVAGLFTRLIEKFPVLATVAYVLVGYIGFQLIFEMVCHVEVHGFTKFGIVMGIILAGIGYSKCAPAQRLLDPLFAVLARAMGLVAQAKEALFGGVRALVGR